MSGIRLVQMSQQFGEFRLGVKRIRMSTHCFSAIHAEVPWGKLFLLELYFQAVSEALTLRRNSLFNCASKEIKGKTCIFEMTLRMCFS